MLDELAEQAYCARCVPYPCFTLVLAVRQMSDDFYRLKCQREYDEREARRLREAMALVNIEKPGPKRRTHHKIVPPRRPTDGEKRYGDERHQADPTPTAKKRGKKNKDDAKGGKRKGSHSH